MLGGDEGGIDGLAGIQVDAVHPPFARDLTQETLDHPPVGEEAPVAEVVLSHDFPGTTLPQSLDETLQVTGKGDGGADAPELELSALLAARDPGLESGSGYG